MGNSATYLLFNSTLTESNYDSSMGLNRLPEGDLDSLIDKSAINRVLILQWRDLDDPEAWAAACAKWDSPNSSIGLVTVAHFMP